LTKGGLGSINWLLLFFIIPDNPNTKQKMPAIEIKGVIYLRPDPDYIFGIDRIGFFYKIL